MLYALVPTAIYDHGVTGVYETEDQAREVAAKLWPKTDGHHAFKIIELELGATYHTFHHTFPGSDRTVAPDSEPRIIVVPGGRQLEDD